MRNPELTPTVITDVNGKVTTVHKRDLKNAQSAVLPAPGKDATKSKTARAYKPTPEQTTQRHFGAMLWHTRIDKKLTEALRLHAPYNGIHNVSFRSSDVETYSVLSVANYETAIVMLTSGIRSKEEAIKFLESHGLSHLAVDYSEVMDKALHRKLKAQEFSRYFHHEYSQTVDIDRLIDAAETDSIAGFRNKPHSVPLPKLVLQGELSLADLKTMTAGLMNSTHEATVNALIAINKGEKDYTAKQLRLCLQDYKSFLTDDETIEMLDRYGMAFTRGVRAKKRAYAVHLLTKEKYQYSFKGMNVITYSDVMDIYGRINDRAEDVVELFESGVKADVAAKQLNAGMTIPQIIAIGTQEAPQSISSGWL